MLIFRDEKVQSIRNTANEMCRVTSLPSLSRCIDLILNLSWLFFGENRYLVPLERKTHKKDISKTGIRTLHFRQLCHFRRSRLRLINFALGTTAFNRWQRCGRISMPFCEKTRSTEAEIPGTQNPHPDPMRVWRLIAFFKECKRVKTNSECTTTHTSVCTLDSNSASYMQYSSIIANNMLSHEIVSDG